MAVIKGTTSSGVPITLECTDDRKLKTEATVAIDMEVALDKTEDSVATIADSMRQLIEYSGGNPIYVGEAAPGVLASAATWRIKKVTYTSGDPTDVSWADGVGTFTKEWDERANYDYTPDV